MPLLTTASHTSASISAPTTCPLARSCVHCTITALALFAGLAQAQYAGRLDTNLIVNASAEFGPISPDGSPVASIPGWLNKGNITVVRYGAGGIFPSAAKPGPPNRGLAFFCGGPQSPSPAITQVVDLSAFARIIDQGQATFRASAYLGGGGTDEDLAYFFVLFQKPNGDSVYVTSLFGPNSLARANQTGLFPFSDSQPIPPDVRFATVVLQFTLASGTYSNGYADDLTLTVSGPCESDFNFDGGIDGADVNDFFIAWESGSFSADFNNDGGVDGADVQAFFDSWEAAAC